MWLRLGASGYARCSTDEQDVNAAMRTYCRLLAANPGGGAGGRVGRLPGDPQGTGRVPRGVGPADGGAGGRAPPRTAGTAAIEEGRDLSSMGSILADTAYRLLPT